VNLINKKNNYLNLITNIENLLNQEQYELSLLANAASLIKEYVLNTNWVGFYLLKDNLLILGPFQGRVACNPIIVGSGVCSHSVLQKETIVVKDVHKFVGHIACDEQTNSEIVVPIFINNRIYGVLDIDSKSFNRFSKLDKYYLEQIVGIISSHIKRIQLQSEVKSLI